MHLCSYKLFLIDDEGHGPGLRDGAATATATAGACTGNAM